jgi:hypothetical protein
VSRDYRVFMSGAIVALIGRAVLGGWDAPWWVELPLSLIGIWVLIAVGIGWVREWRGGERHDVRRG